MNAQAVQSAHETAPFRGAQQVSMRAAVINRYGGPDELSIRKIPHPLCSEEQVLVQVRAAGVNPIDWRIRNGSLRLMLPARFPLVLGFDVAGEIVRAGRTAREKGWSVGDEVMCYLDNRHGGGYAEFAVAGADIIAPKPCSLSFEEAAATPLASLTALQALRDLGKLSSGQELLVNGASGGVGTFAVQLGAALGARVTGVCSASNLELARELGAQEVIDYARADFTSQTRRYDVVFDAVGKSSYWKCRRVLKPGGCYITTLPSAGTLFFQVATKLAGRRCRTFFARPSGRDLKQISQLIDQHKLRPIVQQVFPLERVADAHRASEAGHTRGKLVLAIGALPA